MRANRFSTNPIITPALDESIGANINGPSLLRAHRLAAESTRPILPLFRPPSGQIYPPGLCRRANWAMDCLLARHSTSGTDPLLQSYCQP